MGIVIRQSIISSIAAYCGAMLGYFTYLYLNPLIFTPKEIGIIRLLEEFGILFYVFSAVGMPETIIRYFPRFKNNPHQSHNLVYWSLLLPFAGFLLILAITYLFKDIIIGIFAGEALGVYVKYVPIAAFFILYFNIIWAHFRAHLKNTIPVFINEILKRLLFIVAAVLFYIQYINFDNFIKLMLLSFAAPALLLYIIGKQAQLLHTEGGNVIFKKTPLRREMLSFSAFMVIGIIGNTLSGKLDLLALGALSTLSQTGIYAIAVKIALMIEMPRQFISQVATPLVARAFVEDRKDDIYRLYQKTALNQLLVSSMLWLLIWLNIDAIFALMPNGHLYVSGTRAALILGLAKVVDMSMGINFEILLNSHWYKFGLTLMVLMTFITAAFNYIFVHQYGIEGAAWAMLLSYTLFNTIRFFYIRKKMHMQPFTKATLRALAAILFCAGITFLFKSLLFANTDTQSITILFIKMVLSSTLLMLLFAGLILKLRISEDISHLVESIQKRLR